MLSIRTRFTIDDAVAESFMKAFAQRDGATRGAPFYDAWTQYTESGAQFTYHEEANLRRRRDGHRLYVEIEYDRIDDENTSVRSAASQAQAGGLWLWLQERLDGGSMQSGVTITELTYRIERDEATYYGLPVPIRPPTNTPPIMDIITGMSGYKLDSVKDPVKVDYEVEIEVQGNDRHDVTLRFYEGDLLTLAATRKVLARANRVIAKLLSAAARMDRRLSRGDA